MEESLIYKAVDHLRAVENDIIDKVEGGWFKYVNDIKTPQEQKLEVIAEMRRRNRKEKKEKIENELTNMAER